MASDRPKRKTIPVRIKREVCERQGHVCARCRRHPVSWKPKTGTKFDHEPALRVRDIAPDGRDYDPPQWSATHIDALCGECHHIKTNGTGATTAGTDTGKIKKERKREKARAGIDKPKPRWPKRKMTSHNGFPPRGSTPMRRKR